MDMLAQKLEDGRGDGDLLLEQHWLIDMPAY